MSRLDSNPCPLDLTGVSAAIFCTCPTQGALDVLADRLMVRFVAGSERVLPLHISGPNIVVSLPADCVRAEALAAAGLTREEFCGPDKQYGLNALVFNMVRSWVSKCMVIAWWRWGFGSLVPGEQECSHDAPLHPF
mgnify:CR=1 FL=1